MVFSLRQQKKYKFLSHHFLHKIFHVIVSYKSQVKKDKFFSHHFLYKHFPCNCLLQVTGQGNTHSFLIAFYRNIFHEIVLIYTRSQVKKNINSFLFTFYINIFHVIVFHKSLVHAAFFCKEISHVRLAFLHKKNPQQYALHVETRFHHFLVNNKKK